MKDHWSHTCHMKKYLMERYQNSITIFADFDSLIVVSHLHVFNLFVDPNSNIDNLTWVGIMEDIN